MIFTDKKNQ